MSSNKIVLGVTVGLIILTGLVFFGLQKEQKVVSRDFTSEVTIDQTWRLPEDLEEVSGIAFLDDHTIACVQDEEGIIFLYNLQTSKIEKEINFSGGGDYEGIAIVGNSAFVLESDGTLYKIENFQSNPQISRHDTPLTEKQDVEGLCHDSQNNRLLLAIKEKEPETDEYKGIYAVNPKNMQMQEKPVFRLHLQDPFFEEVDEKRDYNKFKPSEINIHPTTGEFYMLEGANPKLLILDPNGKPKKLHFLDNEDFPQPEGLTFDSSGNTYISNEGNPATIHQVSLQ